MKPCLFGCTYLLLGVAAFGFWGIVPVGGFGLWIWWYTYRRSSARWRFLAIAASTVATLAVALFILPINPVGSFGQSIGCCHHLNRIVAALRHYHDVEGTLPPTSVRDSNGKQLHSWRVLILPYLGYESLYQRYHFDEPWDGPHNSALLDECPEEYQCPWHRDSQPIRSRGKTSYFAVVGAETAWCESTPTPWNELRPELSLVIELNDQDAAWLEPRDITLDDAIQKLVSPNLGNSSMHNIRRSYLFDLPGEVRFGAIQRRLGSIPTGMRADDARALFTRDAPPGWRWPDLRERQFAQQRWRLNRQAAFLLACFATLTVLPFVFTDHR